MRNKPIKVDDNQEENFHNTQVINLDDFRGCLEFFDMLKKRVETHCTYVSNQHHAPRV